MTGFLPGIFSARTIVRDQRGSVAAPGLVAGQVIERGHGTWRFACPTRRSEDRGVIPTARYLDRISVSHLIKKKLPGKVVSRDPECEGNSQGDYLDGGDGNHEPQ